MNGFSIGRGMMAGLALMLSALAAKAQGEVRVYNWSDYINPAVLDAFTRETGIKVVYDTFDQMETVETKLVTGKSGYDLVVVTASFLPRHIPLKLYIPSSTRRNCRTSPICGRISWGGLRNMIRQQVRRELHVGAHRPRL